MECNVCHRTVDASDKFCDGCGAAIEFAEAGPPRVAHAVQDGTYDAGRRTATIPHVSAGVLPGTPLLLGDGETVWRQYAVSRLRRPDYGEGVLYVTDARVVFYARAKGRGTQRASALVQQTKLGDVTGLSAFVSHRVSLGWFVAGLVFIALFLEGLASRSVVLILLFGLLAAGSIAMLVLGAARRGSVGVQIHSGATQQSPIAFGQFGDQRGFFGQILHALMTPFLSLFGVYTAFDVLVAFPGEDAERVIEELGALIFDLQSRGDLAGTHWGVDTRSGRG